MPIFGDDHLDSAPGSAGPRTGLLDSIDASFNQTFKVDAQFALQQEIINRWEENLKELERLNGETLVRPSPDDITTLIRARSGEDVSNGASGPALTASQIALQDQETRNMEMLSELTAQDARFMEAGLPSFEDLFAEVVDMQRKVEERSAEVAATSGGFTNFVGGLIGGIPGSFSTRDPLIQGSALFGGFGRSIATRLATEAGIVGAVEAGLQFGPVAGNRELAGLRETTTQEKLQNVLFAAGGAAALRGLFEGGGAAFRSFNRSTGDITLDVEDAQLRSFLGERPNSPAARAGIDLLDDQLELEAASPYGTSYPALRRFDAEVAEAEMALLGRTDTAIGRALPDVPLSTLERAADFQIVREQAPEVAARADKAQARVDELDQQLDAVTQEIEGRTLIDAVRLVDEDAAAQLEMLAARDIPEAAKALEAEVILTRVGKERILKATEDAEIAPRKQSQRLRQQRKAANKELRLATRAMEAERAKLNAASAKVKQMLEGESTDLLGYAIATRPMTGSKTSSEVVTAQRARITEGAEELPERVPATIAEDGTVDVGLPSRLPAGFLVPDESGTPRTVADLVADFDEDARLIEAMRSCSL